MLLHIARRAVISLLISGVAMDESDDQAAIRDAWSEIDINAAKEIAFTDTNNDAIEFVEKPLFWTHHIFLTITVTFP